MQPSGRGLTAYRYGNTHKGSLADKQMIYNVKLFNIKQKRVKDKSRKIY